MTNKEFIHQRICIFSGKNIDPNSDEQVVKILRDKFNVLLPQRPTLDESLASSGSEHEVLELILKYRALN